MDNTQNVHQMGGYDHTIPQRHCESCVNLCVASCYIHIRIEIKISKYENIAISLPFCWFVDSLARSHACILSITSLGTGKLWRAKEKKRETSLKTFYPKIHSSAQLLIYYLILE